ncbi:Mu transposase C-terminal domain-containing protein [Streptomyces sp. NPDC059832]|uniref:Mu transposase C-terminal domain-containing protein n=1 Tax=Streptomyces sp. NPDC059832 TaxID=3346966 RepID=UPI00365AF50A
MLRPSTKAVDAALLLARAMTPEPVRPGWSDALRMSRSVLPYASLLPLDERLAKAAAKPVIVPETVVSDRGKAYISDNFRNACRHLGISFQPSHPDTPTDKPHIERTLGSVSTMFAQYVAGYTGRSAEMRGKDPAAQAAWSIHELQELLQEWVVAVWQTRPHDGLRDPLMPDRPLSPNEKYAALVSAAGYVPVALAQEEYIQLMPRERRVIGPGGVRINNRTYDARALGPHRRQSSGAGPDGRLWEVHYDPYDISRVLLGLPAISPRHNTVDITSAVCQVLIEARTGLVLVDEIHLMNLATTAGEELSDHLKYFTEHLPATYLCRHRRRALRTVHRHPRRPDRRSLHPPAHRTLPAQLRVESAGGNDGGHAPAPPPHGRHPLRPAPLPPPAHRRHDRKSLPPGPGRRDLRNPRRQRTNHPPPARHHPRRPRQ